MTNDQQTAYERALMRAHRAGIHVAGRGTLKTTGEWFYATNSATEINRWHVVIVRGGQLVCDCIGAQRNRYCQHRAMVRHEIETERQAAAAEAQLAAIEATRMDCTGRALAAATLSRVSSALDASERRETAMLANRASNKGFSIWASR